MTPTAAGPTPGFLAYASFRRLTVDEYHHMIRTGVLTDGEPIELLEGYMVQKMSRGTPRDDALDRLEGELLRLVPADWFVRTQRAVTLGDSEPEPDAAVVRAPRGRYRQSHPTPAEIALLVEVADSSLSLDRIDKSRAYARAGVACYWVVNVRDRQIEVLTDPTGPVASPAYRTRADYAIGTGVPFVLDGTEVGRVAVADVIA